MTAPVDGQIPPSVLRWLEAVPADTPVAMLMRHSVRPSLPDGDAGFDVPITDDGAHLARSLGELLGRRLRSLRASPLLRCVQTAEALRVGAAVDVAIRRDRLLGDPGVYVLDTGLAGPVWRDLGHEGVMAHLVARDDALPGMAAPEAAARYLVHHMLAVAQEAGLHVFVTHDSVVTATAARLLGKPLGREAWPWYLEAAFFWQTRDGLNVAYRDHHCLRDGGPLCQLVETDVIEFARREVAATLGLQCATRFFLAGGAFKSLLTGRPPRDLDIWAPSEEDRGLLVAALLERGAAGPERRPFSDAYQIGGRVVEIPNHTEPASLEERLSRFDIGLSAVGVEYAPGDRWRAVIHPLASESVRRRQVLLLKPLVNWKYCLWTLHRMDCYAAELSFDVPPSEEEHVWTTFRSQPLEMRKGMIERYLRVFGARADILERACSP
jgi:broad specificity phosphatase PhoE